MVLNIGQSQSRVTDLADDSCGKMAPQKVVRGAGMGDWQGVSSHALRRVTVNQVPAKHPQVGDVRHQSQGFFRIWSYLPLS